MIRTSEPELVANLARLLYWCDKAADADELLNLVSTVTSPTELPALMATLDSPDLARVLLQKIAVHRPAESLLQVIHVLRRVSPFKVDQLLNDVSCFRPPDRIPPVLEGLSEQETQHVLKATRAVRGPNGCNDLAQALRPCGPPPTRDRLARDLADPLAGASTQDEGNRRMRTSRRARMFADTYRSWTPDRLRP